VSGGVTVLVRDGRIAGVEPGYPQVGSDWPVLDYPDATVLPGLIDAHVHLGGDSEDRALERLPEFSDDHLRSVIEAGLRRHLAAGVTTVRDLGDRAWSVLAWRDGRNGRDAGARRPAVVASGPPITSPGGHCGFMGGEARGADALRAAVRERAERRADVVKIMVSGGVLTPGTDVVRCQFTLAEVRVAVAEAHRLGLPVTAHAHGLPAVEMAVQAGADGIEHCGCLTDKGIELPADLLRALVSSGIEVCPTLGRAPGGVIPPRLIEVMRRTGMTFEKRQSFVANLAQHGVRVVSGTDGGIGAGKPHGILASAIADLVAGGLPATEALATATAGSARACGLAERKGRVAAGFDADLLVTRGDPLTDIAALSGVRAVVIGGNVIDHDGDGSAV
jgi:imidazolonepropionase-like amidohydrolase